MKTLKLSLLMFVLAFVSATINAQTQKAANWCAADQHNQEMQNQNPALIQMQENFMQQARNYIENNPPSAAEKQATYIIPVVFHVVTDNGAGNVTKANIDAVLVTINQDFQRNNTDASQTRALFLPYVGSIDIEFRLAHIDPNGDCTEGIVRVDSPLSTDATDAVKSVSYWDSKKYFNIWTVANIDGAPSGGGIIAGYAQFPWSGINSTYGIVVDYRFVSGGERTLTHEIGHCLGLLHTFQSGCGSNCSNSGDYICDTPPVTTSSFGCPTTNNTCSNDANGPDPFGSNVVDQIENYMSYNSCQNMFSAEQGSSMLSTLTSTSTSQGLAQLMTPTNLANTGTADPYGPVTCKPNADFTYNRQYICEGGNVTYTDQSWGSAATAWNWTFTGGTPATGNTANPTITYNTAGVYGTTLVASNSASGTGSKTINNIVTVSSLTADYTGPIIDGFENTTQFNSDWRIEDLSGGQTWQNNNAAATTGSRSVRLRNFITSTTGEIDELISPSFDISALNSPTMTFKVAFKRKLSSNNDRLFVYYSTNCGESWVLKTPLVAASMSTAPDQGSIFTPSSPSHWLQKSVDLSAIAGSSNVRFRFAFTSGGGNDVYIDDINIDGTVGISEMNNIGNFNVYPNPTTSSAQISFNLVKTVANLTIRVRNAVGQEVTRVINNQSFIPGKYTLKIDEQRKLSKGIYFIEFTADDVVQTQKLIVQ